MAAFDKVDNMYDVTLKPRLLRSLVRDHLPDEKQPFPNPSELSHVVSLLKTHRLLSLTLSQDKKVAENSKSAIDAWVNRLMLLVSSNLPDKCWAGICLVGVTCQECNSERFITSYSLWFHKLYSHMQPLAESHFVKVASCASMSDLLVRLGGFPNLKKDGTSHASKLVQPVLKMLTEDNPDSVLEGAVCLLCTLVTFFPASLSRHYDSVEAAIISRFFSEKCSVKMLQNFSRCLALLPKSKGDGDSWSLLMQRILFAIHIHVTDAFQGVEEESRSKEAMEILVPPGKDPPPPLMKQTVLEPSDQTVKRSELLTVHSVSALMLCCCTMITTSCSFQKNVPVRLILKLTERVLMIDGSFSRAKNPFTTVMQQESVCSQLPVLHLYSLELLTALVKGVRSQLLPHAADIVRLLTEYFSKSKLPELRIKVYLIIKILLTSMGVGMALHLNEEVIKNVFADLDFVNDDSSKVTTETLSQTSQRKRKHADSVVAEVSLEASLTKTVAPLSVKIAALEAVTALLTVAGASRSESWRGDVDRVVMTVATNACKSGWAKEDKYVIFSTEKTSYAEFQLAALRALLSSILSPARIRPPYLSQALHLFHTGIKETGTQVAEFCAHALLALEVLIHPRSLPVTDLTSTTDNSFDRLSHRFPETIYAGNQNIVTSFSGGPPANGPTDPDSDNDNLYESWLATVDEPDNVTTEKDEPSAMAVEIETPSNALDEKVPEESEHDVTEIRDEVMVEKEQFEETIKQCEETGIREEVETVASDAVTAASGSGIGDVMGYSKMLKADSDEDSSSESIPDIVDGDPDSD